MMMSLYLWEFKCKTATKRQVRQEQDNELVQDPSTCCVQHVQVNIIPQDTRWLFNSFRHIYMTGPLKQQCMVTIQKRKCLQALRPCVTLPLGYEYYVCKYRVTLWYSIPGVSHWNGTWAKQIILKFKVLLLKLNIPLITKLIIFIEIKDFLHCYLFLPMHVVCYNPNNGNHLELSGQW
jgi:hypothetical protein